MPQLPSHFHLCGIKVSVVKEDDLVDRKKCIGEARYSEQTIAIDTKAAPKELTEQSFLHEVIHFCFYIMGEDELRKDERLVDLLAQMMYQYQQSVCYEGEEWVKKVDTDTQPDGQA